MAGLSDVVRKAVAIANSTTATLQATVKHAAFDKTYTRSGQPNHKTAVSRKAIVEKKQELKTAIDGSERVSQTKLTFLGAIDVDVRDTITLPDGTSPTILAVASPLADDGTRLITEVWF